MALRVNILQCWGRPGLARLILHGKYYTCWWPGVERSQSISSLSVDPVNSPSIFHHLYHKINIVLMRQFNLVQTFQRTYASSIKLPHPINLVLTLSDDILDCDHLTSKHYLMRWSTIHFLWQLKPCCSDFLLTHWGQDKKAVILKLTFSDEFLRMKIVAFLFKFHWTIHHWFIMAWCQSDSLV